MKPNHALEQLLPLLEKKLLKLLVEQIIQVCHTTFLYGMQPLLEVVEHLFVFNYFFNEMQWPWILMVLSTRECCFRQLS